MSDHSNHLIHRLTLKKSFSPSATAGKLKRKVLFSLPRLQQLGVEMLSIPESLYKQSATGKGLPTLASCAEQRLIS